uniref:Lipocalin n=1 Tax=Rhipicephalus appendiculatus TaxID=34631 RepID=A0A131Z4F0_RHIAP
MRLHHLFVNCLFLGIAQSGKSGTRTIEKSVVRHGWKFLARDQHFLMLKRTYNVSGGLNNSICVMIPFSPSIDKKQHTLNTTFTYRNLSSTHKMYDPEKTKDNASYWPIARFTMKFYALKLKRKTISGKRRLDFVNSTTLTMKKRSPPRRQCELWISVDVGKMLASHKTFSESKEHICNAFFNRWCDTTNVQLVYDVHMCNRELLIPDS